MKKIHIFILVSLFLSCNKPVSFDWESWVNGDADKISDEDFVDSDEDVVIQDQDVAIDKDEVPDEVADETVDEDIVDEDIVDEDIVDEDIVDEDTGYVNPCEPTNPCVEENKTVCTDTNEDGTEECACVADYHLNGTDDCISDTKMISCVDNAPDKATATVVDVEVTWNGSGWNTAADCAWTCDAGYEENVDGDACVAIADPCVTPDPCNDLANAVDDSCVPEEVTSGVYTGVFSCTCDTNYIWTVNQCVEHSIFWR